MPTYEQPNANGPSTRVGGATAPGREISKVYVFLAQYFLSQMPDWKHFDLHESISAANVLQRQIAASQVNIHPACAG